MSDTPVILGAVEASQLGRFWSQVLLSNTAAYCIVIGLLCLLAIGGGLILLARLHRRESPANAARDSDGTATIEFALVSPILLFFGLVLTQTTTLMAGHIFVNYSAYAAVRSAIVQIPADYADDAANQYTAGEGRTKRDRIKRAAVFAVAPVAGEREAANASVAADQFVAAMRRYYDMNDGEAPRWLDTLTADRLRYAADHTFVTLLRPTVDSDNLTIAYEPIEVGERHEFEARDPVTARVAHRFDLGVPYVNRIFADAAHDDGDGRYIALAAEYTLTLEGIRDELPPQPSVPRSP